MRTHGRAAEWIAGNPTTFVLDDHFRVELVEDLAQPIVHVSRTVAESAKRRLDELGDLLDRRLAEDRRRLADEVLPELAGCFIHLR
jgi:hypothetical protein